MSLWGARELEDLRGGRELLFLTLWLAAFDCFLLFVLLQAQGDGRASRMMSAC